MSILAGERTKIIVQGITGREGTILAKDSLDYGATIVGGTSPGKGGRDVYGVPVYDCIRQMNNKDRPDTSIVVVPPAFVKDAVFEAIDNEIELIVIVTERVPRRDTVEILCLAKERGARIIGPNSLGLISPGKTKLGMIGGPAEDVRKAYQKGYVGIISRSGGMTTEIAFSLTVNRIGQSTCISIGGDPIVGSTFIDLLPLYEKDPCTKALLLFCEPGGTMEEDLAEYVAENGSRLPIIAFVAGRFADKMPGVRFGHAASIVEGEKGRTKEKIRRFKRSGILVAEDFSEIPSLIRETS
jgi:succinyl-CoA synthetase alpha subunit